MLDRQRERFLCPHARGDERLTLLPLVAEVDEACFRGAGRFRGLAGNVDLVNGVLELGWVGGRVDGGLAELFEIGDEAEGVERDEGGGLGDFVDGEVVFAAGTGAGEMVKGEAELAEEFGFGIIYCRQLRYPPEFDVVGRKIPMYEIVISSPSLMGSSALRKAFLPEKLTAALGMQEWLI